MDVGCQCRYKMISMIQMNACKVLIQLSLIINKNSSNNDIYNDFEMLVENNDDDENKNGNRKRRYAVR
jgi:hypothetical protein